MNKDHYDWIENNYPKKSYCINRCNVAVRDMTLAFDDLEIQVGMANGVYHCWCKDKSCNIVDPTYRQFDGDINYFLIADRFLKKHEIETSIGALFLDDYRVDSDE